MPQSQQLTPAQLKQREFFQQLDEQLPALHYQLPSNITPDKFRAVVVTAVNQNPDLLYADRSTFFVAASKCATDGLLPDGREAAFVVYSTKVKKMRPDGTRAEVQVDAVQYLPMIAGIRKRMRNTGEILSANAEVVYEKDEFWREFGDDPKIHHKPPPLGQDRGRMLGAYAIIKLANGEVLRDVLDENDIGKAREMSRGKNGPMWTKFTGEAWRKTALRRCSKQAPQSSELQTFSRDDEGVDDEPFQLNAPFVDATSEEIHDAPETDLGTQSETITSDVAETQDDAFAIVDLDGVEHTFATAKAAGDALIDVLQEAAKRGLDSLNGAIESNDALVGYLHSLGEKEICDSIIAEAKRLRAELRKPAQEPPKQESRSLLSALAEPAQEGGDHSDPGITGPAHTNTPPSSEAGAVTRDPWFDQESLEIKPKMKNGKPDWETWLTLQFGPKLQRAFTTRDMSLLQGDNQDHIRSYKSANPRTAEMFDAMVKAQWAKVKD